VGGVEGGGRESNREREGGKGTQCPRESELERERERERADTRARAEKTAHQSEVVRARVRELVCARGGGNRK